MYPTRILRRVKFVPIQFYSVGMADHNVLKPVVTGFLQRALQLVTRYDSNLREACLPVDSLQIIRQPWAVIWGLSIILKLMKLHGPALPDPVGKDI